MRSKIAIVSVSVILCGILAFVIYKKINQQKLAWVNMTKVYNEFVYKKELETKLTKTLQARNAIMDSLEFELKMLSRQIKSEGEKDKNKITLFEVKKENYISKKKEFEQDNDMMQKQFNEQILTQINQYLKDYGKQGAYTFIYGADGSGALMYADDGNDITDAVVKYVNEKYKGKIE